jgi:small subunit ribosomal protein S3
MGHKVHPTSLRLGITEDWRSHWVADKKHFGDYLVEDQKIRTYTKHNYYYAGISSIEISRMRERVHATVHCARPGLMIGRRGVEVERLKSGLEDLTGHSVEVSIEEVEQPQLDAQLVAEEVAQQIERRSSFRRAMRRAAEMTMNNGAEGVKIHLAGRLGGSEMARREKVVMGQFPLQTLRAKIDYGFTEARTKYGHIGVKVWVNRGLLPPGETIKEQEESEDAPDA